MGITIRQQNDYRGTPDAKTIGVGAVQKVTLGSPSFLRETAQPGIGQKNWRFQFASLIMLCAIQINPHSVLTFI